MKEISETATSHVWRLSVLFAMLAISPDARAIPVDLVSDQREVGISWSVDGGPSYEYAAVPSAPFAPFSASLSDAYSDPAKDIDILVDAYQSSQVSPTYISAELYSVADVDGEDQMYANGLAWSTLQVEFLAAESIFYRASGYAVMGAGGGAHVTLLSQNSGIIFDSLNDQFDFWGLLQPDKYTLTACTQSPLDYHYSSEGGLRLTLQMTSAVPDCASTVLLLGLAVGALGMLKKPVSSDFI